MSRAPRIIGFVLIACGVVMVAVGGVTYYLVHRELSDERIVVADDATNFAGQTVEGPFTAYAQATVIKEHALDMADGLTYAELPRDDERRETVMQGSFLRASLFTSVVAFGVAALVGGLGLLFVLVGVAVIAIARSVVAPVEPGVHSAGVSATTNPDDRSDEPEA